MLAKCEDRLVRPPLPLGLNNVRDAADVSMAGDASDFDYRRIVAVGAFRHDQEMLVGPRVREGQAGFFVVTPLELAVPLDGSADGAPPATILVNRGWIARGQRPQAAREHSPAALPAGLVRVEGLLRAPWKRNFFTPDNRPDKGEFYFPDVVEMARLTGSLPVWIEATMGKTRWAEETGRQCPRWINILQSPTCSVSMTWRPRAFPSGRRPRLTSGIVMLSTSSPGMLLSATPPLHSTSLFPV